MFYYSNCVVYTVLILTTGSPGYGDMLFRKNGVISFIVIYFYSICHLILILLNVEHSAGTSAFQCVSDVCM